MSPSTHPVSMEHVMDQVMRKTLRVLFSAVIVCALGFGVSEAFADAAYQPIPCTNEQYQLCVQGCYPRQATCYQGGLCGCG